MTRLATLALVLATAMLAHAYDDPELDIPHPPCAFAVPDGIVEMPCEMARQVNDVIACESSYDPARVGKLGELGLLQLHPVHRPELAALGLDYDRERDRIQYAVRLWQRSGWQPWSCKP